MSKLDTAKIAEYENNIRHYAALATQENIIDGQTWYAQARELAQAIASRTGHSLEQVAAVIASLSPQNKWARNLVDAAAYCEAAHNHQTARPKACTFGQNQIKGWAIANGTPWQGVLVGQKVESFISNILGDYSRVTVDIWATRAATLGQRNNPGAQYRAIEQAYKNVAAEYNTTPAQFQAIVWCAYRGNGK